MKKIVLSTVLMIVSCYPGISLSATQGEPTQQPTIILVHGAFAESSSWNGVISNLISDGYRVVAAANPLRSVKSDAAYLSSIISSINGPVILVGHSYGGEVISQAAHRVGNVRALVYVAGFALDTGESATTLGQKFPEGTLGEALAPPVAQSDGSQDLYIEPSKFRNQFAADVPEADAVQMAATQRPVTNTALAEPVGPPAWKELPSWFIYGALDKNIPAAAHAYMAERAKAREVVKVNGASHVVMISHAHDVAALIKRAASTK